MSVGSVGQSTSAYWYLQSLLQQQTASATGPSDPVTALLSAFYPSSGGDQAGAAAAAPGSSSSGPPSGSLLSPDTLGALIAAQSQQSDPGSRVAAQAQAVFGEFDSDGDGQISKTEFESAFGAGADMSKVDGLFNALDANGDGAISPAELTQAAQEAYAHHHHHHMHGSQGDGGGEGSGSGGGLNALLSSTDLIGATAQTTSNPDGSSSTTITYSDGSTVTMTTPPTSPDGSGSSGTGSESSTANLLEKLISWQAQLLAASASTIASPTPDIG